VHQLHLWLKFYPKDWNGDHNLRACSLAARGLMASLLEPMHEATPYGHLLVRGKKPEYAELAVIASCKLREVKYGIEELVKMGVLSTEDDGVLYSRRMVRDEERRKKQALGGTRGMATRQAHQRLTNIDSPVVLEATRTNRPLPIEARSQIPDTRKERSAATAEKAPSRVREFITWFAEERKAQRNGATYFVKWEAHGAIVKRLLAAYEFDRLKKLALVMFKTNDEWVESTDRGLETFSAKINWLEERLCQWETARRAREAV
jgi:hypothetical protein